MLENRSPRFDDGAGYYPKVSPSRGYVTLELGEWRPAGSFTPAAWARLTPDEADETARLLRRAAGEARRKWCPEPDPCP